MTNTTIYRTGVKAGSIDAPITELDAASPVAALEAWAARCDMTDFSIDTDGLRVILCPANSPFRYYAYREVPKPAPDVVATPAAKLRALCDDAAKSAKAALARGDKASEEFHAGRQCAFLTALNIVRLDAIAVGDLVSFQLGSTIETDEGDGEWVTTHVHSDLADEVAVRVTAIHDNVVECEDAGSGIRVRALCTDVQPYTV